MVMDFESVLDQLKEQEGGLVEVLALDASYQAWVNALAGLTQAGYQLRLVRNGENIPVELDRQMFTESDSEWYQLSLIAAGQEWTSTMSATSMIDWQGSPGDIRSLADVTAIWQLMRDISASTDCRVVFIPESIDVDAVGRYLEVAPPQ